MSEIDVRSLEKEIHKRKRLVAEWASKMHDLAEEGLPQEMDQIHAIADGTYRACVEWKKAVDELAEVMQG